jgi:hypothetical protein
MNHPPIIAGMSDLTFTLAFHLAATFALCLLFLRHDKSPYPISLGVRDDNLVFFFMRRKLSA